MPIGFLGALNLAGLGADDRTYCPGLPMVSATILEREASSVFCLSSAAA